MSPPLAALTALIVAKTPVARSIWRFELADPTGAALPGYSSGAHIAVTTPRGLVRSYSLNEPGAAGPGRYAIAVARGLADGGAASLIEQAQIGDQVAISAPRNHFPVAEGRDHLLIAGGIGITPIRSIFHELRRRPESTVRLLYLSRDPGTTAYFDEFRALTDQVTLHHSAASGRLDLWPYLANPGETHVYCCGPTALADEVRALTAHWDPRRVHFEQFTADAVQRAGDVAFTVLWRPTGASFVVPAGQTVLDALRRHGIIVDSSCNAGTCGTCVLRLVAGDADHRDVVLTDGERRNRIIPCVSRAHSPSLEVAPPEGPGTA